MLLGAQDYAYKFDYPKRRLLGPIHHMGVDQYCQLGQIEN